MAFPEQCRNPVRLWSKAAVTATDLDTVAHHGALVKRKLKGSGLREHPIARTPDCSGPFVTPGDLLIPHRYDGSDPWGSAISEIAGVNRIRCISENQPIPVIRAESDTEPPPPRTIPRRREGVSTVPLLIPRQRLTGFRRYPALKAGNPLDLQPRRGGRRLRLSRDDRFRARADDMTTSPVSRRASELTRETFSIKDLPPVRLRGVLRDEEPCH